MTGATPAEAVLTTRGLVAGYGRDLPIVKGVDVAVARGALVAVLGPNGAGKSTLVKAVAGLVPVFAGQVRLDGEDITGIGAHRMVRSGLAFVPQTENIFATLTIRENLQVAAAVLPRGRQGRRIDAMFALFPDLAARPSLVAGRLSGGQRQMLATARALLVEPSVLILDEPSAGLAPLLVGQVFQTLLAIKATGVTIVLVEQNVRAALAVADRAVVLVDGIVRHDAPAQGLADDPILAELYFSRPASKQGIGP
ncbi:MAG: ABC transporter ATP-binding protein [Inquilinaceae bacterium]